MGLPSPCTLWPRRLRRSSGEPSGLPGATLGLWTMLAINGGFFVRHLHGLESPKWWKDVEGCGRMWKDVEGCGRMWKDVEGCGRMWKDELKLIQCQYLFYWGACSRQTFRCLDPVAEYNSVSQTWKLQNGHNLDLEHIYIYIHIYIYTHIHIYSTCILHTPIMPSFPEINPHQLAKIHHFHGKPSPNNRVRYPHVEYSHCTPMISL